MSFNQFSIIIMRISLNKLNFASNKLVLILAFQLVYWMLHFGIITAIIGLMSSVQILPINYNQEPLISVLPITTFGPGPGLVPGREP